MGSDQFVDLGLDGRMIKEMVHEGLDWIELAQDKFHG
jgi:hypothetical protein